MEVSICTKEELKNLDNKKLYRLFCEGYIDELDLKSIFKSRIKVFTRIQVGNAIIRVDLISKQNEDDRNFFMSLGKVYTYQDLSTISIKLSNNIIWNKI